MSLSKPAKQLKTLTYTEKAVIIQEVEKGIKKKSEIAKEFGIPANTLSTILKNKEKISSVVGVGCGKKRKRVKGPGNPDVDQCVLKWFKQARDKNIPLSGTLIRAKAEEFGASLGKDSFKASTGWLDGFKERNKISFKAVCGESGAVDTNVANDWKNSLVEMVGDVADKDVFNVDETGLFYKSTPDKTMAFKKENCSGGKHSKDRFTVLIGANMDGSEKLPLLVIGKSKNPCCFKNVKSKPVMYESNRKAWMTSEIFGNWLLDLDKKCRNEKRTILLFIDNCTAHTSIPKMGNVKILFFPPNMTSVLQPMDQGVIKNFKHFYRRIVVQKILAEENMDKNGKVKIDILQASRMCKSAWDKVKESTIANCFRKGGFIPKKEVVVVNEETIREDGLEEVEKIQDKNFAEFIDMDEDLAVCGELSDADILAEVIQDNESSEEELVKDEEEPKPVLTTSQAMDYVQELRRYVEADENVSDSLIKCFDVLENYNRARIIKSKSQLKISSFFKKT